MKKRKKKSLLALMLLSIFSFLNFILAIIVRLYDRNQIVKAIQTDDEIKTLLISKKETKRL